MLVRLLVHTLRLLTELPATATLHIVLEDLTYPEKCWLGLLALLGSFAILEAVERHRDDHEQPREPRSAKPEGVRQEGQDTRPEVTVVLPNASGDAQRDD